VRRDELRRRLDRVEVPDEHEARERAWRLVQAAFAEREPQPRRWSLRPALVLAALAAVAAAVLSPPGQAVLDRVREAIGVEQAAPALFSLPTAGRLLVESEAGVWIVEQDGSKRLLAGYDEGSWSPFGRFVVAARENELAALEPSGRVRWSLARPRVGSPRWGGSRTDTRIAYLSGSTLRVVAGDKTGDRVLARGVARVAPAWRRGPGHVLAYATPQAVIVVDTESGRRLGHARIRGRPLALDWSADGMRLAALTRDALVVLEPDGRRRGALRLSTPAVALEFAPRGRTLALVRAGRLSLVNADALRERVVFDGATLTQAVWSPDGRWLLMSWPLADQWVFDRPGLPQRPKAVANVAEQFGSFPTVGGWCCVAAR
jgi:hypothetical protein